MPRTTKPKDEAPKVPNISALEAAFAHAIIRGKSPEDAAESLGLGQAEGARYMARQKVYDYLANYREKFLNLMAEAEVIGLLRKKITRDTIAEQLYFLSMIPVQLTRGSITGQVAALEALAELLNFRMNPDKLPDKLRQMSDEQLREYVAGAKPAGNSEKKPW